jgi:flagellar basal-body rod modification protein FlgD
MDITMVEGTQQTAAEPQTTGGGFLGKDEFMLLLTTQMRHQDPLEPMDSTAMIAQLAQFSALEQMQNLNESFMQGRQEDGLIQTLLLEGQTLNITLDSGDQVFGEVERVSWIKNEGLTLHVGDYQIPLRQIASMSLATPLPDAENGETEGGESEPGESEGGE